MNSTYLLLGSNEGNRLGYLSNAIQSIESKIGKIEQQSAIYETAAWGITNQPPFLNQVVVVNTKLEPNSLLNEIALIEKGNNRKRETKWGARTLDIDILFFNQEIIKTKTLQIPHPSIAERRFTLLPLCEIAPQMQHPVIHKTMQELLLICKDDLPVNLWK